ncbi:hypothetical protein VNI00_010987 [Paramarasmius palmivorus]|uniref:Uncharacterized protein n=1 Tax=Paramarasmius palmivorus TaxID=297713 RepID=A0AAW0CEP1_9AGAR
MLKVIQHVKELGALRRKFAHKGMLNGTATAFTEALLNGTLSDLLGDNAEEDSPEIREFEFEDLGPSQAPKSDVSVWLAARPAPGYSGNDLEKLANEINQPAFPRLLREYLYEQTHPNDTDTVPHRLPTPGRVSIYHSAVFVCYAPSDDCGGSGMYTERFRANPRWQKS